MTMIDLDDESAVSDIEQNAAVELADTEQAWIDEIASWEVDLEWEQGVASAVEPTIDELLSELHFYIQQTDATAEYQFLEMALFAFDHVLFAMLEVAPEDCEQLMRKLASIIPLWFMFWIPEWSQQSSLSFRSDHGPNAVPLVMH